MGRLLACALLIVCVLPVLATAEADDYTAMRRQLRKEIEQIAAATADSTGRPRFSARVMDAIDGFLSRVPAYVREDISRGRVGT